MPPKKGAKAKKGGGKKKKANNAQKKSSDLPKLSSSLGTESLGTKSVISSAHLSSKSLGLRKLPELISKSNKKVSWYLRNVFFQQHTVYRIYDTSAKRKLSCTRFSIYDTSEASIIIENRVQETVRTSIIQYFLPQGARKSGAIHYH